MQFKPARSLLAERVSGHLICTSGNTQPEAAFTGSQDACRYAVATPGYLIFIAAF